MQLYPVGSGPDHAGNGSSCSPTNDCWLTGEGYDYVSWAMPWNEFIRLHRYRNGSLPPSDRELALQHKRVIKDTIKIDQ